MKLTDFDHLSNEFLANARNESLKVARVFGKAGDADKERAALAIAFIYDRVISRRAARS